MLILHTHGITRLMALKVMDADNEGHVSDIVLAIEYALDHGAHILVNSYGGSGRRGAFEPLLRDVERRKVLFVAAAGNDGTDNDRRPMYPASYPSPVVLSVTAIDPRGRLPSFSNRGPRSIHLAAPGAYILSTTSEGRYSVKSGTSMAAPFAGGVAALVLSELLRNGNISDLDGRGVLLRNLLLKAVDTSHRGVRGAVASGGVLSASRALAVVRGQQLPDTPLNPIGGPFGSNSGWGVPVLAAVVSVAFVAGVVALCVMVVRRTWRRASGSAPPLA